MEGISFSRLRAHSIKFEALSQLPYLRVLVLDGVKMDSILSGIPLAAVGHVVLAVCQWTGAAF